MAMLVARASGLGVRSLPMSLANSRGPQPLSPVLLVLGATVLAAALWASCGGGASGRVTNPGTPTGSYTLIVTGSSAYNSTMLTHSVTLQLVVN
jgi:hypothetical protein